MAICGLVTFVRIDMDSGGSQCIGELVNAIVFAECRCRDSRGIQLDRLLLRQRQSEEKFVSESVKVYWQKDAFTRREHGQRK